MSKCEHLRGSYDGMSKLRKLGAGRVGKYMCVWKWKYKYVVVKRRGGRMCMFWELGEGDGYVYKGT